MSASVSFTAPALRPASFALTRNPELPPSGTVKPGERLANRPRHPSAKGRLRGRLGKTRQGVRLGGIDVEGLQQPVSGKDIMN